MNAYLIDDEPLAISRLKRLLLTDGRVKIVGTSSDPRNALEEIPRLSPDVLFLDIQMPELSGFELLQRLDRLSPLVIFTTAYGEYALDAFKVNSIDYLLKPIHRAELSRAVSKLQRMIGGVESRGDVRALLNHLQAAVRDAAPEYLTRVASRMAGRVEFIEVRNVTHFYAQDKLTFASTSSRDHALDLSITDLEQRLPPQQWIRIHRATLLNVEAVRELHSLIGGRLLIRLKGGKELQVARDRAPAVRQKLGL